MLKRILHKLSAILKVNYIVYGIPIIVLFLLLPGVAHAQTEKIGQFWNEFAFTRPLVKGWSTEFDVKQIWSGNSQSKSIVAEHNQWHLGGWIHFYPGARWKTSFGIGYIDNQEIDSVQPHVGEWRWSIQATYYLKKIGYTLSIRSRIENRGRKDSSDIRKTSYRFREELKFLYPLGGSKTIRGKIWYLIASDEIMFQNSSYSFFDRNQLVAGVGYAVTDDIQIETTYVNQYLKRKEQDQLYQAAQAKFVLNNFLGNVSHRWKKKPDIPSASGQQYDQ